MTVTDIHKDPSALTMALAAGPVETAPSSLLNRIGAIVTRATDAAPMQRHAIRWSSQVLRLFATATQVFRFRDKLTLGDFGDIHYN